MSPISAVAVYFIIWWLVFFAVLPFGARSQTDEGEFVLGSERGAPVRLALWRKVFVTSLIAALVFAIVFTAIAIFGLTLEDLII